jgi:hypothetical protein
VRVHSGALVAPDERTRLPILLDAAADAVEAWAREGTSKAANRFNAFELQAPAAAEEGPAPGEVGGPADESGVRRTKTGWRRILGGRDDDEDTRDGGGKGRR